MNSKVHYCLIITSSKTRCRKKPELRIVTKTGSSHNNKQQEWSKEKSKSSLFIVILNQKRQHS